MNSKTIAIMVLVVSCVASQPLSLKINEPASDLDTAETFYLQYGGGAGVPGSGHYPNKYVPTSSSAGYYGGVAGSGYYGTGNYYRPGGPIGVYGGVSGGAGLGPINANFGPFNRPDTFNPYANGWGQYGHSGNQGYGWKN